MMMMIVKTTVSAMLKATSILTFLQLMTQKPIFAVSTKMMMKFAQYMLGAMLTQREYRLITIQ